MKELNELVELAKEFDASNTVEAAMAINSQFKAAATRETILAIAEAFRTLEQRAEAAEAAVDTWRKESAYNLQGKNDAREYIRELEGKLEALEKQQPVAWLVLNSKDGYVERNPDVVANLEGSGLTKCKPLYLGP